MTSQTKNNETAPMSRLARALCHLAAVNPERIARGRLDDWQAAIRTGLALSGSFLCIALGVTAAFAIAFEGRALVPLIPAALLIAAMIVLIDHAMLQSLWLERGARHATARGLPAAEAPRGGAMAAAGKFLQAAGLAGFRILLSGSLAFTIAGLLLLLVFGADIRDLREAQNRVLNAPVHARAEAAVMKPLAAARERVDAMDQGLSAAAARIAGLEQQLVQEDARARAAISGPAAALEARRAELITEAQRARSDAAAELHGQKLKAGHSGLAGPGLKYSFAVASEKAALAAAAEIGAEIDRLAAAAARAPAAARAALAEARGDAAALKLEREAAAAFADKLAISRAAGIDAALKADPAYAPLRDGLALRLQAMHELAASPAVAALALGLKLLIMLIEMGGLLCKILLGSPTVYGIRSAAEFEMEAAAAIDQAAERLEARAESRLAREDEADERAAHRDSSRRRRETARQARARYTAVLNSELSAGGRGL